MKWIPGIYPLNRPLTDHEINHALNPKTHLNVDPRTQLSVVRINSTYLECVDFTYSWRGPGGFLGGSIIALFGYALYIILSSFFIDLNKINLSDLLFWSAIECAMAIPTIWVGYKIFRVDAFRLTHYPIRFNRENRMVYAFRRDGSIFSAQWEHLYFVLYYVDGQGNWHLRAHVLKEDGRTVIDSFGIPNPAGSPESALELWEYIRRYMEEGPKEAYESAHYFMPIWDRKESVKFSFLRLMANFSGHPMGQIIMSPILLLFTIGRVIAMKTSKIPVWPEEVETACPIKPDDPYIKDWRSNSSSPDFI